MTSNTRKLKFRAETRKVLDIVINSLYSHPDIFLRELVSNASDALDRLRFRMLTDPELDRDRELRIDVVPDREAGSLTVRDNGIGMTGDEMAGELGTIAGSGTRGFLEKLSSDGDSTAPELIGQFGVGFYSAFMVADRVEVLSRPAGSGRQGHRWSSTGHDTFTVKEEEEVPEGTSVILHLKEGMDEYLDGWRLRELVRKYSDFIAYPVYVMTEEGGDREKEPVNSQKPIWTRPEEEVTDEEYAEFYRHLSYDPGEPLSRMVFHAEGTTEFYSLLYIPSSRTIEMLMPDYRTGVRLFIRKVLIEEEADELLPRYLRFVKGVVESSDLPLNISRETLQENRTVRVIRKALTGRVIGRLEEMMEQEGDKYGKFFDSFGDLLKEGVYSDEQNRERLSDLLLVRTSGNGGSMIGLREFVHGLPEGIDRIYYLTGEDWRELANSPYLESAGGREVLLFDSPVDEFMLQVLGEYRGKKLVSLSSEVSEEELTEAEKAEKKHAEETFAGLLEYVKDQLGERVAAVRFSPRLRENPCIIVSDRGDPGEMMRRVMRSLNQEMPEPRRILELNPGHPVIARLQELFDGDRSGQRLKDCVRILYDLGTVTAGGRPEDPAEFARMVAGLLT